LYSRHNVTMAACVFSFSFTKMAIVESKCI
jgi:hypothetical protein